MTQQQDGGAVSRSLSRSAAPPPAPAGLAIPELKISTSRGYTQARVYLHGRDVYVGKWPSPETERRYASIIERYLACGRRWPPPVGTVVTVEILADLYVDHCYTTYTKRERTTSTALVADRAMSLLAQSGLAAIEASAFGPRRLAEFQTWLASQVEPGPRGKPATVWSLSTIREYVRHVVAMFRWATTQELGVELPRWHDLLAVPTLRRGRSAAPGLPAVRVGRKRVGVATEVMEAALAKAPPMVAAMARLQLAGAMRPSEVCAIARSLVRPSVVPGVWEYAVPPEVNKCEHEEEDRVVYLGAAAMAILEAWWGEGDPDAPVFSAARSEASRNAARDRTLPRWPSHERAARRRAKARAGATFARAPGDRYTASSYRRAIERACDAAGVPRWTPYQLRHAGATEVCSRTTLEVARVILGHRSIETTERYYVHVARAQVAAAAVVAKNP